jgi:hypothetical protein
MATTSEVKSGLDAISDTISESEQRQANAKANLLVARNAENALTTTYADVISTINGYTPTGAFETLAQDELSKLTAEFLDSKAGIEAELVAIGVVNASDYSSLPAAQKNALVSKLTTLSGLVTAAITTLGG